MILSDPATIDDSTDSNDVWNMLSQGPNYSEWLEANSTATSKKVLRIQHRTIGRGATLKHQHNITVSYIDVDDTDPTVTHTSTASISVTHAPSTDHDATDLLNAMSYARNVLAASGAMAKFMNNMT